MSEARELRGAEALGNAKEVERHVLPLREGGTITVEETEPGTFEIVDNSLTQKGGDWRVANTALAFKEWDDDVENIDRGGDAQVLLGLSESLRWKDVELTSFEIHAPSLDRLKEALEHVTLCAYCSGDL